jgi:hypothetical protein
MNYSPRSLDERFRPLPERFSSSHRIAGQVDQLSRESQRKPVAQINTIRVYFVRLVIRAMYDLFKSVGQPMNRYGWNIL